MGDGRALTVLIVDDHPVFADALALAVNTSEHLTCVGTAGDMDEALSVADEASPDIVVMDYGLVDVDGITAARKLRERHPAAQVLMLTGKLIDRSLVLSALDAGTAGLLSKGTRLSTVVDTIQGLHDGTFSFDRDLLRVLLESPAPPDPVELRRHRGGLLTAREQQILELLASGVDAKAAAARLQIRVNTCRGYIKTLLSKLDAHSQLEAVAVARARGLLDEPG